MASSMLSDQIRSQILSNPPFPHFLPLPTPFNLIKYPDWGRYIYTGAHVLIHKQRTHRTLMDVLVILDAFPILLSCKMKQHIIFPCARIAINYETDVMRQLFAFNY